MEPVMYISEFHKMPNYMNKECETCFVKQKSKCNSQTARGFCSTREQKYNFLEINI